MDLATSTRFAQWARPQALIALVVTAVVLAWCLIACLPRPASDSPSAPSSGGEDLKLYRRIAERVHAGEGYYDAAGDELRQRGYPTGSVFNWRPPVSAWLIGSFADPMGGQLLLLAAIALTLLLAYIQEQKDGSVACAVVLVIVLIGAFLWSVDGDAFFAQELWAGTLIALSVCAYALGRWRWGLAAGLLALFFRELALPYVGIAAFLAYRQGRRQEVALWMAGLVIYALFMIGHAYEVTRRLTSADRVEAEGWVQFGGARFILSTVQMNAFLFQLPLWVAACYLVLSLLGLAGWREESGTRVALTVAAYLAAFAVVGKPVNNYWGLMIAPLLAFGFVRAPAALRDLIDGLRVRSGASAPARSMGETCS